MANKAATHGALYTLATYANLVSGKSESREATVNLAIVVSLVNAKLKEMSESRRTVDIAEGLIGAVASVSLAEV
jgi:hypothetical protein